MKTSRTWLVLAASAALVAAAVFAADEIAVNCQLSVSKDALVIDQKPGSILIDMVGDQASDVVQSFSESATTTVTVAGSMGTNGWCMMRNVTTNTSRYILVGVTNATDSSLIPMLRLNAEEVSLFRLAPGQVISACPIGGTVNLRTIVIED